MTVTVLATSSMTFHADAAETGRPAATNATAPIKQVTLERVVTEVLEHNPEVNFYATEIAAAKGADKDVITVDVTKDAKGGGVRS